MILQFSVSNYRCFRALQTINLAASSQDKTLPENCISSEFPGKAGKRWLKGVVLYGANASGKTTVLEALGTLAELVAVSAQTTDPKEAMWQIEPFALCHGEPVSPTSFAVAFVTEGVRYEYRLAATRERIWHESLRAFPRKVEQLWFSRDWNDESGSYAWTPERPTGFQRDPKLEGYTLSNMLFLSKAVASNRHDLEPVHRWFKERLQFLFLNARDNFGFTKRAIRDRAALYERIVEILRHADIGVTQAELILKRPVEEKQLANMPADVRQRFEELWLEPELTHRGVRGVEIPLEWKDESAGTHRLFGLVGPWLDILKNGHTVCVDELETSMHPLMVRELLRLFFSEKENPKGAQLLFTTHNPLLLDPTLLRRDQVWFTEKDGEGESHLYPLTDYSPRKGESLVRGYLSGRYGGVPFIPEGLLGGFPTIETRNPTEQEASG